MRCAALQAGGVSEKEYIRKLEAKLATLKDLAGAHDQVTKLRKEVRACVWALELARCV